MSLAVFDGVAAMSAKFTTMAGRLNLLSISHFVTGNRGYSCSAKLQRIPESGLASTIELSNQWGRLAMPTKSWAVGFAILLFALTQSAAAGAVSITRTPSMATTPKSTDFPSTYNSYPTQVGYVAHTTVNSGDNHMFRDTIPIVCGNGKQVTGANLKFSLTEIRDGADAGDNDTMNFWLNGQNKYQFNVGKAAQAGAGSVISLDLANLPALGTGPATITGEYTSLTGNPLSLIPDMRAGQRLSFAIQDDTNIAFITVNYTCEVDPDFHPSVPITVNPCCPPWNSANLLESLQYVGSGSSNAPYTMRFTTIAGLVPALQAYLNYINAANPSLTILNIEFQLYDQGTGVLPLPAGNNGSAVGPVSGMTLTANSTNVKLHTHYNTNTPAIFTGVATPGTATTPSSYPMQVGRWYMVHTGMWTDTGQFFSKAACANVDVYVRVSVLKGPRPQPPRTVLELMTSRGSKPKTVLLDGPDISSPVDTNLNR